jgi:hypothetical protein
VIVEFSFVEYVMNDLFQECRIYRRVVGDAHCKGVWKADFESFSQCCICDVTDPEEDVTLIFIQLVRCHSGGDDLVERCCALEPSCDGLMSDKSPEFRDPSRGWRCFCFDVFYFQDAFACCDDHVYVCF